jgi:hypothetical protein
MDTLQYHELVVDRHDRGDRVEFALFLKVLLHCLERSKEYVLLEKARLVVMNCTRGYKTGDPNFSPLVEAIEIRLKKLVGDRIWKQAREYTRFYIARRHQSNPYITDPWVDTAKPIAQI